MIPYTMESLTSSKFAVVVNIYMTKIQDKYDILMGAKIKMVHQK